MIKRQATIERRENDKTASFSLKVMSQGKVPLRLMTSLCSGDIFEYAGSRRQNGIGWTRGRCTFLYNIMSYSIISDTNLGFVLTRLVASSLVTFLGRQ